MFTVLEKQVRPVVEIVGLDQDFLEFLHKHNACIVVLPSSAVIYADTQEDQAEIVKRLDAIMAGAF